MGSSNWLTGSLDNVWFSSSVILQQELVEQLGDQDPTTYTWYDRLDDFLLMGEGTFPAIDGIKGVINGSFVNGDPSNFTAY